MTRPLVSLVCGFMMLAGGAAGRPALADAPAVNVTIQPSQITLGETAQLTITTSGTAAQPLSLPEVQGLEFGVIGQSRRVEIINGATLVSTSVLVRVTPQTTGVFTIPGITPRSQPLVLRVTPDNGGSSPPGGSLSQGSPGWPGGQSNPPASGIHMTADGAAFIRLVLPKHEIYVGESIPVEIEVGMRAGFVTSLDGLPTLDGGDFTLNNLSHQPERVEKIIDGKPFTVLTWHSIVAAVKPGTFSMSVGSPITVRIRTRPQRDSLIDDMLGDPFMQNFFGATVPKEINISSQPAELTVQPLPTAGRPADFSGAVGSFTVASDISAPAAAAGDPLTLRMHVAGSGNFDRVDTGMLTHLDQWKTYPPKSSFKQSDAVGYKGEKTFEQPLIASKPGAQTLPGLSFSYFDPTSRHYETARSAPLNVTISPSLADRAQGAPGPQPALNAAALSPDAPHTAAAAANDGLRPDHAAIEAGTETLIPLYLQRRFLAIPSLLALACAGGWLVLRSKPRAGGARPLRRRAVSKAQLRAVKEIEAAAAAGDAARFLTLARAALQSLAAGRRVAPAMTPEELGGWSLGTGEDSGILGSGGSGRDGRIGGDGELAGTDDAMIRRLFALADEANYSGHAPATLDFAPWLQLLRRRLLGELSP